MADRKINGREFGVGVVMATDAIHLQARLMQVIGAGVDRLPEILKARGDDATDEMKAAAMSAAVSAFTDIFAKSDATVMTKLLKDIVEMATVKRESGSVERVDLDGDFTNDKASVFPVAVFVLQEVLGDFFSGLQVIGSPDKPVKG